MRVTGPAELGRARRARRRPAQQRDLRHDDRVDLREHGHRDRAARARTRTAARPRPASIRSPPRRTPSDDCASGGLTAADPDALRQGPGHPRPLQGERQPQRPVRHVERARAASRPTRSGSPNFLYTPGDLSTDLDDRRADGEARLHPRLHQLRGRCRSSTRSRPASSRAWARPAPRSRSPTAQTSAGRAARLRLVRAGHRHARDRAREAGAAAGGSRSPPRRATSPARSSPISVVSIRPCEAVSRWSHERFEQKLAGTARRSPTGTRGRTSPRPCRST